MQGRLSEAGEDTLQDYLRNAVFFFFQLGVEVEITEVKK